MSYLQVSDLDSCQGSDHVDRLAEDFILSGLLSCVGWLSDILEIYWDFMTHAPRTSQFSVAVLCWKSVWVNLIQGAGRQIVL